MKNLFKMNIQKSYLLTVGILSITTLCFCYSYALFTVQQEQKEVIQIVAGTLYSKLSNDDTQQVQLFRRTTTILSPTSKTIISLEPHEEKTVTLKIENVNNRDAKFNLYYQILAGTDLKIGYLTTGTPAPTKDGVVISQNQNQEYIVRIYNKGDSEASVSFGSNVGLADKPLEFPKDTSHLSFYEAEVGPGVQTILAKANQNEVYQTSTEKEVYPIKVSSKKQENWLDSQLIDYRYIGMNPNNYVLLQGEIYRIVGIFSSKDSYGMVEKRIKLVKVKPIGSQIYHLEEKNQFASSLVKETLEEQYFLELEDDTQNLFDTVEWYLGDLTSVHLQDLYKNERAGSSEKIENLYQVALLYPSDYQYSYALGYNSLCFSSNQTCQNSWIYQMMKQEPGWFLSYNSDEEFKNKTTSLNLDGSISFETSLQEIKAIYPTVFLKTNVRVVSGDGSYENPYQFAI